MQKVLQERIEDRKETADRRKNQGLKFLTSMTLTLVSVSNTLSAGQIAHDQKE